MIEWDLKLIVSLITLSGTLVMMFSALLLRLTLDPRVRREALPPNWPYAAFPDIYLKGLTRAIIFGLCCVFPHVNNAEMYRRMYNDIDIKTFANPFEKFLGWSMTLGTSILFLGGIVVFITDWFNIWEWN